MTIDDANRRVTEALEGAGGRLAIIALLSIIAGTSTWMLKTEIDQGNRVTEISVEMTALREREGRHEVDEESIRRVLDKLTDSLHTLDVSVSALRQELTDFETRPR